MGDNQSGRCVVLGGGPIRPQEIALIRPNDTIWAADAGLLAAQQFGLYPELCLGDWDSCPQPHRENLIVLPTEKDDTDTHYAARLIVQHGFSDGLLLGGIGGRLDHTIANMNTVLWLTRAGVRCWMVGQDAAVSALHEGSLRLPRREACYFSIFAADGTAEGVSLSGMKYPLENAQITASFPVGVSNEILADWGEVSVKKGSLYLVYSKKG